MIFVSYELQLEVLSLVMNTIASHSVLELAGTASFLILIVTLIISVLVQRYAEQTTWKTALKESAEREKALSMAIQRMRQTLDIPNIFAATTSELRQVINCDRVVIYRFCSDWSGEFLAESVGDGWISVLQKQEQNPQLKANVITSDRCIMSNHNQQPDNLLSDTILLEDTYLQATQGGIYSQGAIYRVVEDIYSAGFDTCYITLLEQLQAKSYIIVAIYSNNKLWGLLAAYQNSAPRQWKEVEINITVQISHHLGVALEHVELLEQTRKKSIELQQEIRERLHTEALLQLQKQQVEETLSDLQQLQTQLIQNEKMAALGQLVAGIAHEINNPIGFISGNLAYINQYIVDSLKLIRAYHDEYPDASSKISEILEYSDLDEMNQDLQKSIDGMSRGTERIGQLVLCLRNFARLDEAESKRVDIHEGIENTLILLEHRLQETQQRPAITVVKNYSLLPLIDCYPSQLNQVFMNVILNAIDALEEKVKNNQSQSNQNPMFGFNYIILIETKFTNKNWIEIRIIDNGIGIDKKNLTKIFDPFFTTKQVGKGTGLGLSIGYQIITQQHGGTLTCNSVLGVGSQFIINIPIQLKH
ncbi:ATP-binding protein [Calothrix sp. PCC 7507]|uniref:GAF domain-containing sensor histidine kinase n=1 Tax=Calothrix sp. PCC 7507 TaxID=99598 RepID=UPI00029EDFC0|nr:ATP-binding protein [Calothrix sp. PCC 7507]AFY33681.1 GAF sensor signal transduction histidine kinase [Calothrix sp. PCC 7507]